jgi:hypothetical protein
MTLFSRAIALLAVLAVSVATAEARSDWVVFAPKGPGFHVELPTEPTVKSGPVNTNYGPARATNFFFKGANGLEGQIAVRDYEPNAISKDPRAYLDEARAWHDRRRVLRKESRFSIGGNPAQRYTMDTNDGRTATVQEVVIGDRFVSVVCFVPKGQDSSDIDRILNSFALTKG